MEADTTPKMSPARQPAEASPTATAPGALSAHKLLSWSLASAAVWFLALWLLDFPKPMQDDLFYAGAALNLAQGGDYSNPLIAGQGFPGHYFFEHAPLLSYALAGWLKLFGISAASVTGFQITMLFVIAASTILILRRHGAPVWLEWLVPFGTSAAFLRGGLRVEPLAIALTMTGLAWFECGRKGRLTVFGSFLLLFLGASASPRLGGISMALACTVAWRLWREPCPSVGRAEILVLAVLAGLVAGLTFLFMIHFRLGEFLAIFHYHSTGVFGRTGHGLIRSFSFMVSTVGVTAMPLLLLLPLFIVLRMRRAADELTPATVILCGSLPVAFALHLLGFGSGWYIFLILLFTAPAIFRHLPRPVVAALALALALALAIGNSHHLVNVIGDLAGQINEREQGERAAALALRSSDGHPVLVDAAAARYAFDYRMPEGSLCLEWGAPFNAPMLLDWDFPPEYTFVVTPETQYELRKRGLRDENPDEWVPFGLRRWGFYRFPRRVTIVPAASCNKSHGVAAGKPG